MPAVTLSAITIGKGEPVVDEKELEIAIRSALAAEGEAIDSLYAQFYGTWEHDKPTMRTSVRTGGEASVTVATSGDTPGNKKLLWLDEGTGPRDIHSKDPARPMRFRRGFGPKTAHRRIRSGSGKRADGAWTSTHHVRNHRIEPREISDAIAKERERQFQEAIQFILESSFEPRTFFSRVRMAISRLFRRR